MVLTRILRAGEGKIVRRLSVIADHIDALEPDFEVLTDAELRAKTDEYRKRYADGETLDELLPEAFATVREAAKRTVEQRHYPVQMMGGAALHLGNVAEMKTGEGKTLAATLPAYLNALAGKGVHVVTVNDYLAKFHGESMGRVYRFLGLDVGVILSEQDQAQRREAYAADITYGTNNEFGFDYLRDNMATSEDQLVQRGHFFAIVDEVDSILIDEARTPLIISGIAEHNVRWYTEFARLLPMMNIDEHYEVDEAKKTVGVTEKGVELVEDQLGIVNLYDTANTPLISFLNNAIKAKELFKKDRDYIVSNGEVLIVDEFTGRILAGRRFNEGLHQAIEAKEGVEVKQETQTLATITLQNYFRLYERLSGMTGTAQTEANELHQTYKLGVIPIPTNKPMVRVDQPDIIYQTEERKFKAVVEDIAERHAKGQPILVGTASVAKSEYLSAQLMRKGIPHEVLNAKYHEKEAAIVAQAGRAGAVTVATNMAGRGTDIVLGGNPEFIADLELRARGLSPTDTPEEYEIAWRDVLAKVKAQVKKESAEVVAAGGLYVLGTERHESRRIDNQLRGRSGRQGDLGESRFYLSLGDDLMQRFNANLVESIMARLRVPEDHPLESKMVSRGIRSAQTQVEQQNFETRKNVLKYDEVLNKQREVIYDERRKVLAGEDFHEQILGMLHDVISDYVDGATAEGYPEDWDLEALWSALAKLYPISLSIDEVIEAAGDLSELTSEELVKRINADAVAKYQKREEELGSEVLRYAERNILLAIIDQKWREHLYEMDYLKEGINLRSWAQRDPLVEYRREGYDLFTTMLDSVKEDSITLLFNYEITAEPGEVAAEEDEEIVSSALPAEGDAVQEIAAEPGIAPLSDGPDQAPAGRGARRKMPSPRPHQGNGVKPQPVADLHYSGPSLDMPDTPSEDPQSTTVVGSEPGRNEPCPCGSGLKYKKCHGAINAK